MSFNYDFTREDGTEVLVTYRLSGSGYHPDDPIEVEFEAIYGLPNGEQLTEAEYEKIETAILAAPPEYDDFYDD